MVNECRRRLTYSADGNASPLTCTSGGLNVLASKSYSSVGTAVTSLGRPATLHQTYGAMCTDVSVDHASRGGLRSDTRLRVRLGRGQGGVQLQGVQGMPQLTGKTLTPALIPTGETTTLVQSNSLKVSSMWALRRVLSHLTTGQTAKPYRSTMSAPGKDMGQPRQEYIVAVALHRASHR